MKSITALLSALSVTACQGDETLTAYGASDRTWHLVEIDGAAFDARATLMFPEAGKITGLGPCNAYSAQVTAPYPWFSMSDLTATRSACKDLQAEAHYFSGLSAMSLSEVSGDALILSNDRGREMVFRARD